MIFTSSEATTNFVVGDISVSGGSLSSLSGSGTTYTATFTPSGKGAKTLDVAGGVFTDSAGNNNAAASQFNWTFDTVVPSMAITSSTVSDGATSNNSTIAMIFTSSEATTNFVDGDISVSGGSLSSLSGSGTTYTATFTPSAMRRKPLSTVAGGVFTDSAGNNNSAASQFNWTYDSSSPSMAITSSTVSDGATSSDSTIAMIFTSSEATTNFVIGDITVVGGSLSSLSGSGTTYTATFTPSGDGAKTLDVAGGVFTDSAGNNNSVATQFNWTYDTTGPSMAITSSDGLRRRISNDSTLAMTLPQVRQRATL